jgi:hypothetical protein
MNPHWNDLYKDLVRDQQMKDALQEQIKAY